MLARLATARNRELVNLSFLAVLTVAGFTAVLVARSGEVSSTSLVYAGLFLALFLVAHIALRMRLPQADPYLLPLVGILASVGLCEIYRIRPALARDQALWIAIGVAVFVAVARAAARLPRARALPLPVRRARARAARMSRSCRPTRPAP